MKILVSKLIEETFEYWPKIIFCDDMKLITDDIAVMPYLNKFNHILWQHMLKDEKMALADMVSWCIFSGFYTKAIEIYKANGNCPFVHQRDLDLVYIVDRIQYNMKTQEWKDFAERENTEIIYDITQS